MGIAQECVTIRTLQLCILAQRTEVRSAKSGSVVAFVVTAAGAHHVGFTKDWKYGFVQNAFLNLKGMDDGSITVVDLKSEKVVASVDTLKNMGFNPNSIVLLPRWNHLAGH